MKQSVLSKAIESDLTINFKSDEYLRYTVKLKNKENAQHLRILIYGNEPCKNIAYTFSDSYEGVDTTRLFTVLKDHDVWSKYVLENILKQEGMCVQDHFLEFTSKKMKGVFYTHDISTNPLKKLEVFELQMRIC